MSENLLRLLLLAYPRAFRERHGQEVVDFWKAQARETRYRGHLGRLRLAGHLTRDVVVGAARIRWRSSRPRRGSPRSENNVWTGGGMMLRSMTGDLSQAIRLLRRAPGFTALTGITLALGIGAVTAAFSVVESVVLRPLPYPDPDRLVQVPRSRVPGETPDISWPDFRDWRAEAEEYLDLAGYAEAEGSFEWEAGAEALTGARVTRDYFEVMGVAPLLGRTFVAEEDRLDGADAVVLSHALWQERFGGDPGVLESAIPMDGRGVPVVGVMPPGFRAPYRDVAYWEPMQDDELLRAVGLPTGTRNLSFVSAVGRLRAGVALELAQERLRDLARSIDEEAGKPPERQSDVRLVPSLDEMVGDLRPTLYLLLAAAGMVLLVAVANVAGLAFGRAASRDREMAVRAALGAARVGLIRQLLTESVVLAVVAGATGLVVALGLLELLRAVAPPGLPRMETLGLAPTTLVLAAAVSLGSGLLFGLMPALRSSRASIARSLTGSRGAHSDRRTLNLQRALVATQVGLSVVLLTGAALVTNSFARLMSVDVGFTTESVTIASVSPGEDRYRTPADIDAFYGEVLDAVRRLPGIVAASTTYSPPMVGNDFRTTVAPEGQAEDNEDPFWTGSVIVGDGYFETNGIALTAGRTFQSSDRLGEAPVVIVSESMAKQLWPGEDPLGKRFRFGGGLAGSLDSFDRSFFPDEPFTVVGVAADVRRQGLAEPPRAEYYRPHGQIPWGFQYLIIRTAGEAQDLAGSLRRAVWSVDATVPVRTVRSLDSHVADIAAEPRFRMVLLVAFAALTGVLAMVGLYAVMTLLVAGQQREMGIRLALGASRNAVVRRVLGSGLRLVAAGGIVGLVSAWLGSRVLASMLYEVRPTDPPTYGAVMLLVVTAAVLACYGPAHRAGRVDPVRSLGQE